MTGEILKKVLITFFTSMVPVVELRGAIPLGVSMGLSHFSAMIISIIGNLVPVPFIILFIRKVFAWIREHMPKLNNLVTGLEKRAVQKGEALTRWKMAGLCLLVAIPLPGTGAWTGALVAAIFEMRLKDALPPIIIGVTIAGLMITGLTYGFMEIFI